MSEVECDYCSKSFDSNSKLTKHLSNKHTTDELGRIDRKKVEQYSHQNTLTGRVQDVCERQPVSRRGTLAVLGATVAGVVGIGGRALGDTTDFAGGVGSSEDPYQIANWNHLDNVREHTGSVFVLTRDLDQSSPGYEDVGANDGSFSTIGGVFTGTLDGQGNTISDLTISGGDFTGLFGNLYGTVRNLTFANVDISGGKNVGTVAGTGADSASPDFPGIIENVDVSSGSVTGTANNVGGLIGGDFGLTTVSDASVSVDVTGNQAVGGVAGGLEEESEIKNTEVTGTVSAVQKVGGVVGVVGDMGGDSGSASVENSIADVAVKADNKAAGGLVGFIDAEVDITRSASAGTVEYTSGDGGWQFGGVVGYVTGTDADLDVTNAYFIGEVDAGDIGEGDASQVSPTVSGLVGAEDNSGSITVTDSFAAWNLLTTITPGPTDYGPQARNIAPDTATVTDGYYDSEKLGANYGGSGTGLTTSEMQGLAAEENMGGLDFTGNWSVISSKSLKVVSGGGHSADGYPTLQALDDERQASVQDIQPPVAGIDVGGGPNVVIKNSTFTIGDEEDSEES